MHDAAPPELVHPAPLPDHSRRLAELAHRVLSTRREDDMDRIGLVVTAGTGPVEVRWFVRDLAEMLCQHFAVGSVAVVGPEHAPLSVLLELEDPVGLERWLGTHSLLRRSHLRGRGDRRRWYAGVALLEPLPEAPPLDLEEVEIQTTRAGGPGGQHVNRTDSAVIARHLPSGVTVRVQDERSQHQNRTRALARLAQVLQQQAARQKADRERERWRLHQQLMRGRPVRQWEERNGRLQELL